MKDSISVLYQIQLEKQIRQLIWKLFVNMKKIFNCIGRYFQIFSNKKIIFKENTQAPTFVKTLNNTEVDENQPAEFSVQVESGSGDAQTNVEWFHNGIPVRNGMNNIQVSFLFCFCFNFVKHISNVLNTCIIWLLIRSRKKIVEFMC